MKKKNQDLSSFTGDDGAKTAKYTSIRQDI